MKETKSYMEIILMDFPKKKKPCLGEMGHFGPNNDAPS